jgi:hypothetical protein
MDIVEIVVWVLSGVFISLVLGYLFGRIRYSQSIIAAPMRPQIVAHATNKTPLQVIVDSIKAMFSCLFLTILLLAFLGGIVYAFYFFVLQG